MSARHRSNSERSDEELTEVAATIHLARASEPRGRNAHWVIVPDWLTEGAILNKKANP